MPARLVTVEDPNDRIIPVGFPVNPNDLAVFINGLKLYPYIDFEFEQSTNSVNIKAGLQEGDQIQLRVIRNKP